MKNYTIGTTRDQAPSTPSSSRLKLPSVNAIPTPCPAYMPAPPTLVQLLALPMQKFARLGQTTTSLELHIRELSKSLTYAPAPSGIAVEVSLKSGFDAVISKGKKRSSERSAISNNSPRRIKPKMDPAELRLEQGELRAERRNISIQRMLAEDHLTKLDMQIRSLASLRATVESSLSTFRERDLELEEEMETITALLSSSHLSESFPRSSSRRKFLPEDHESLPKYTSFQTLTTSGTFHSLDFSDPCGHLVASTDEDLRVYDLVTGTVVHNLIGHSGIVEAIQVEGDVCISAGSDSTVRIWDLRKVNIKTAEIEDGFPFGAEAETRLSEKSFDDGSAVLRGHTDGVSALYFEESCLVTGGKDKTLRQWDLGTGQCVLTMDLLWAVSHSDPPRTPSSLIKMSDSPTVTPSKLAMPSLNRTFSIDDFAPAPATAISTPHTRIDPVVNAVQFWGCALVSGTADGVIRLWDMRTGQAHRSLYGHTGPVTTVMFDQAQVVSSSIDGSIRIWDLRTGSTSDMLQFANPVSSFQFDSRRIVACAGETSVKLYNRTTRTIRDLSQRGHSSVPKKLKFVDKYLVTGGDDGIKSWAI